MDTATIVLIVFFTIIIIWYLFRASRIKRIQTSAIESNNKLTESNDRLAEAVNRLADVIAKK